MSVIRSILDTKRDLQWSLACATGALRPTPNEWKTWWSQPNWSDDKTLDRNTLYAYYRSAFFRALPEPVRNHRKYFAEDQRGFGEAPFHAMWFRLFRDYQPINCLEIGVYRGQTISLWALLGSLFGYTTNVNGLSPLTASPDSVSSYLELDYEKDIYSHFAHFGLERPTLSKTISQSAEGTKLITGSTWDLIYIDGSHEYDDAVADLQLASSAISPHGLIVMDDAALYTEYRPDKRSFAGHPGPSRAVCETSRLGLVEVTNCGHNRVFQLNRTTSKS